MAAMTPAEEARFLDLWRQGLSYAEIGRRTGVPEGTAKTRARALRARGVDLPARPRGGAATRLAREIPQNTVHDTVQSHDELCTVHDTVPNTVHSLDARLTRVEDILENLLRSLSEGVHRPVQSTVHSAPPLPPGPSDRWNLYIKRQVREVVIQRAEQRGITPSQLATEWLWQMSYLDESTPSTPS